MTEPITEAGRALFSRLWAINSYEQASKIIATVQSDILAIEAELRASLAEKVRALPGVSVGEGTYHEFVHRAYVLAFIEGSDPVSRLHDADDIDFEAYSGSDPASPEPTAVWNATHDRMAEEVAFLIRDTDDRNWIGRDAHLRELRRMLATPPVVSTIPDRPLDADYAALARDGTVNPERFHFDAIYHAIVWRIYDGAPPESAVYSKAEAPVTGEGQ